MNISSTQIRSQLKAPQTPKAKSAMSEQDQAKWDDYAQASRDLKEGASFRRAAWVVGGAAAGLAVGVVTGNTETLAGNALGLVVGATGGATTGVAAALGSVAISQIGRANTPRDSWKAFSLSLSLGAAGAALGAAAGAFVGGGMGPVVGGAVGAVGGAGAGFLANMRHESHLQGQLYEQAFG